MLQDCSIDLRMQWFWMISRRTSFLACAVFVILAVGISDGSLIAAQQPTPAASADRQPSFEVASVKPSKPYDGNHNWDSDSDRVTIENYTLRDLIVSAYGLKSASQ